jgi:hypothetical protein
MAHGGSGDVCHSPPSLPAPTPQEPWRKLRGMLTAHKDRSRVNFSFCERPWSGNPPCRRQVYSSPRCTCSVHGGRVGVAVGAWPAHGPWRPLGPWRALLCFERSVGADGAYVRTFDHRASARSPVPAVACRLSLCNPAACLSTDGSRHREGARPSPASCMLPRAHRVTRRPSRHVASPFLCSAPRLFRPRAR